MRASLSGAPRLLGVDVPFQPNLEKLAVREAERILAYAEPQTGTGAYGGYARLDDLIDDEPAILIETLTAFLEA